MIRFINKEHNTYIKPIKTGFYMQRVCPAWVLARGCKSLTGQTARNCKQEARALRVTGGLKEATL